ncbi:MAG: hypothetical protein KDM64_12140, partial [Verrucomicrobiae bacterium]|nr:hypothetical protein [Verrucomicrobiae bacterium]
RLQVNLALLEKHQKEFLAKGPTIDVEVAGLRIGDFRLVTFPGELTVRIGLHIKKASPHEFTFVAGYTNGYIYYSPTAEQLKNPGYAQEDCDSVLAPEWQELFETRSAKLIEKLSEKSSCVDAKLPILGDIFIPENPNGRFRPLIVSPSLGVMPRQPKSFHDFETSSIPHFFNRRSGRFGICIRR